MGSMPTWAEIDAAVGQFDGFQHGFGVGGDPLVGVVDIGGGHEAAQGDGPQGELHPAALVCDQHGPKANRAAADADPPPGSLVRRESPCAGGCGEYLPIPVAVPPASRSRIRTHFPLPPAHRPHCRPLRTRSPAASNASSTRGRAGAACEAGVGAVLLPECDLASTHVRD